ncbi:Uncharacterised protein [Porphyromonas cangingivalis]|nr:Uncharacterised protein [Porphyromonas cangingivalis]
MDDKSKRGGIRLGDSEGRKGINDHKVPCPHTGLDRSCDSDTAHDEGNEPDTYPKIRSKTKSKERSIEEKKIPPQRRIE